MNAPTAPTSKHTPHSVSWDDAMDSAIRARAKARCMTVSEYMRACAREEMERAQAKAVLHLMGSMDPIRLAAAA